jgi:hypothetical protein
MPDSPGLYWLAVLVEPRDSYPIQKAFPLQAVVAVLEEGLAHQDSVGEVQAPPLHQVLPALASPVVAPALLLPETHLLLIAAQPAPEMVLFLNLEEL